jgi:hypothetical protein
VPLIGDGGSRYSFQSEVEANGDFNLSNEIAYFLIPTNTPQNIIDGYNEILNNLPDGFKKYLRESFGSFAERNGGKNPLALVDLRLQKVLKFLIQNKL